MGRDGSEIYHSDPLGFAVATFSMGIYWEYMRLVPSVSLFNGIIRNSKEDIHRSFVAVSRKSLFNLEVAGYDIIFLTSESST